MPITRCATPDDAVAALAALQADSASALFLFFGSEDPQTGESWCADCVTADPVLRRACSDLRPALTLHECPVGVRSAWKNQPEHPYRQHPAWRLARIPTLILFEHGNERGRLVEADCANVAAVRAFLLAPDRTLSG